MGFSFYENDPTLRNKFSFLLKNHVWRQLVGVVEVKLNVDSLIAFYIVAFVHLQKGAIKRISFCEQI